VNRFVLLRSRPRRIKKGCAQQARQVALFAGTSAAHVGQDAFLAPGPLLLRGVSLAAACVWGRCEDGLSWGYQGALNPFATRGDYLGATYKTLTTMAEWAV